MANGQGKSDERAAKLAEDALNKLTEELKAGKSDGLQNYLDTMGRFHRYSWGNVLLIASQRPTATRVAGFHTWHSLDRHVKSGEKGIMIFAPIVVKQREEDRNRITPDEVQGEKKSGNHRLAGFRAAHVFDISQTEGKDLPEFSKTTGNPQEFADKLKALVEKQGISLEYDHTMPHDTYGISSGGKIRLRPGMEPAEEFSVLVHELAHEMLHHNKDQERLPKVVRETQAEAVAYVVSRGIGLETNSAAADYIKLYDGDKKALGESLAVIQKTSSSILDELLPDSRGREERPLQTSSQPEWEQTKPEPPVPTPDQAPSISMER